MATVQLLGRGTYGPHVSVGAGVSPLWQYRHTPPAQNTVIIFNDGSVQEVAGASNLVLTGGTVHTWIYGGTDFRCEQGSWEYNMLTAAGYTWRVLPDPDTYTQNYVDNYVLEWGDEL
jgi:hypothetical protein